MIDDPLWTYVLVTGSRNWDNGYRMKQALGWVARTRPGPYMLVHGAAFGADSEADYYARKLEWAVTKVPANWKRDGRAAGPIRNVKMVDGILAHTSDTPAEAICLAFPLEGSRGTWHCMEYAAQNGIPVWLHKYPASHRSPVRYLWTPDMGRVIEP